MLLVTLIAPGLSAADLRVASALLGDAVPVWLDEGEAVDLRAEGDAATVRAALEEALPHADVIVQDGDAPRRKRLLIADMDSTMITCECIDELADYAGLKAEVAAVTEAAMRGELDFVAALDARVALLKGLEATAIERCRLDRVRLTPGARTLVQTMRAHGATTILVSGGFTAFADPVGAAIGFDRIVANTLEISRGRLTGTVARPVVDAGTKRAELLAAGVPMAACLAVGDGANDIPMLEAAGLGIAFHAKPKAAAAADAHVRNGDLTSLLWAQGLPRLHWTQ